jgi:hypothetical protein
MARAKNQTELVHNFVTMGAVEGKSGSLEIHADVLYNTENGEYLPIARRLGRIGDRALIINACAPSHHGNRNWQHDLVMDDISQFNYEHPDDQIAEIVAYMAVTHEPVPKHPVEELERQLSLWEKQKTAAIEKRADARTQEEKEWCDRKITQAEDVIRLIKDELRELEFAAQKDQIEELVRTPEILQKAIKDGTIPAHKIRQIIATKDKVRETIDQVENYLSVLMQIPTTA